LFGPLSLLFNVLFPPLQPEPARPVLGTLMFLALGLFLMGLIELPVFRRRCKEAVLETGRIGRRLLVDMPARMVPLSAVRFVGRSGLFLFSYWSLFKPLVVCGLLVLLLPRTLDGIDWLVQSALSREVQIGILFLIATLVLNSRLGVTASALLGQGLSRLYDWI